MKIKYIDYNSVEMKEIECIQAVFNLDKDNVICLIDKNTTLEEAPKIPKKDIQFIESYNNEKDS